MIKNFKVTNKEFKTLDIVKALEKEYKGLEFSTDDKKFIESHLPHSKWTVRFDLVKANTELANAFRSFVLDEIPWTRITCYMADIVTDDPRIQRMTNRVQNNIWMIPTTWVDDKDMDDIKLEISVSSGTENRHMITSNDIKMIKGPDNFKWVKNINLAEIEPGRTFKATLALEKDISRKNATYCPFFQPFFKCIEFDDLSKIPSYSVMPEEYSLGFSCLDLVCSDTKWAVRHVWECIFQRLTICKTLIEEFEPKSGKLPYISDFLKVSIQSDQKTRYEFVGETYAIGNIISKYGYLEDTSIDYICCGDDHPEDNNTIVKLIHPDHASLLITGIGKAIKAVNDLAKSI